MCAIVGAILGAAASVAQGAMAAQAHSAQAAIYERQAEIENDRGEYEAGLQRDRAKQVLGSNRATALANGLALEGTPDEVILDSTVESELDVAAIRYGAEIKSGNYRMQAGVSRMQAGQAMAGGLIGGLSPLIKGVGKTFMGRSSFAAA